jgi:hypothetical protein
MPPGTSIRNHYHLDLYLAIDGLPFTAFSNEIIWRAPLPSAERELANAIREKITALRPHLLDFIRLNEEAPSCPHAG